LGRNLTGSAYLNRNLSSVIRDKKRFGLSGSGPMDTTKTQCDCRIEKKGKHQGRYQLVYSIRLLKGEILSDY
jgi:hypothetical protein